MILISSTERGIIALSSVLDGEHGVVLDFLLMKGVMEDRSVSLLASLNAAVVLRGHLTLVDLVAHSVARATTSISFYFLPNLLSREAEFWPQHWAGASVRMLIILSPCLVVGAD